MRLILTRHGETEENKLGICQSQKIQGTLSKEGIEQAEKLALRLKDEQFDEIYSSNLARSADTAKIIAKYHPDTPFNLVEELREHNLGSLSGKHKSGVYFDDLPKDAETHEALTKRVKNFLDKVYEKHPKGNVLFVGHGGTNKALVTLIMGKHPSELNNLGRQSNTCINIFEIKEDKKHIIHLINCTEHLC